MPVESACVSGRKVGGHGGATYSVESGGGSGRKARDGESRKAVGVWGVYLSLLTG